MINRVEEAEKLFKEGYNCSQSVFAAFCDLYGIDRDMALKLSSSFGGGLGRMREVCGAVSGMSMVAGMETGSSIKMDPQGKKHNYDVVQKLSQEFKDISGSIICKELLGMMETSEKDTTPQERTKEYYTKRPCVQLVKDASRILEQALYDISICPVETPEQIIKVADLANEVWHEHYDDIIGSAQVDYMIEKFQSEDAMKEQITKQGYQYNMLVSPLNPENVAGYFAFLVNPEDLFLSKLYIAKKYRGRDYSRKVLEFLKQLGFEKGISKIWLTVNRNNTGSIAVYEKLGFVKARTQIAEIGAGYVMDDYIMEMKLGNPETSI